MGAAAVGGLSGIGQYLTGQTISGSPITTSGIGISATTGILGGAIGGAFTRTVGYGAVGTALPALAAQQQTQQSIAANAGFIPMFRNILGGLVGGFDPSAPNNQNCTCSK
jgi:hypothetical protein